MPVYNQCSLTEMCLVSEWNCSWTCGIDSTVAWIILVHQRYTSNFGSTIADCEEMLMIGDLTFSFSLFRWPQLLYHEEHKSVDQSQGPWSVHWKRSLWLLAERTLCRCDLQLWRRKDPSQQGSASSCQSCSQHHIEGLASYRGSLHHHGWIFVNTLNQTTSLKLQMIWIQNSL